MMNRRLLARAVCLGLVGSLARVSAGGSASDANPQEELNRLRGQVAQLEQQLTGLRQLREEVDRIKAESSGDWMNERRAEQVKTLIREVLGDAETRVGISDNALTAGHDGKKFFLASADGDFLMNIGGQMQFRYIYNHRENPGDDKDANESGFQLRRTKLKFTGHVTANRKIKYEIVLAADRGGGEVELEDFALAFPIADGTTLSIGQMKLPFAREELLSSSRQLGIDRSSATEYLTLDRGQGVKLAMKGDDVIVQVMVSDGADSEGEDFNEDDTDLALTARIDAKLKGNWKQAKDFVAWLGEDLGVFVGGAIHYEVGETGTNAANDNVLLWTADGLVEVDGISVMLAVSGLHTDNEFADNRDDTTFLAQVAAMIDEKTQPYLRYELLDIDGVDTIGIITAGFNRYINKHNAKFTMDVVYGLDPLVSSGRAINSAYSDGLGLATDAPGEDGQVAVRTQFQLLF